MLRRRGHRVVFIAERSFEGTLSREGIRGAARRPRAARRERPGPWPILEGLHPRHGAGLSQADDRAARGLHRPDLRGPLRRRALRRRAAGRDPRRGRPRRHRRGQRRLLPRPAGLRPPLGANRLLQPGRGEGPAGAAAVLRLPDRRPLGLGGLRRRVRPGARPAAAGLRRVLPRARRAAARRARVHPHVGPDEPVAVPVGGRLRARRPAREQLAQPGVERADAPTPPGSSPSRSPRPTGRSST